MAVASLAVQGELGVFLRLIRLKNADCMSDVALRVFFAILGLDNGT